MSKLRNVQTGQVVEVEGADAIAATRSGEWVPVDGIEVQNNGVVQSIPLEELPNAVGLSPDMGFQSVDERQAAEEGANFQRDYGGLGQGLLAGGEGVLSGLSLGGSDFLLPALGADTDKRALAHPGKRAVGQVTGMVGGAVLSGSGSLLGRAIAGPAGLVTRGSAAVATKLGGGVAAQAAGAALEGVVSSAGIAAGEMVLRDPEMSAEAFLEEIGPAALIGGVVSGAAGAAFAGIAKGAKAVKAARSEASPLVNMNSPAGQKMAKHIADSHGQLDAVGAGIIARHGKVAGNREAMTDIVQSDLDDIGTVVTAVKERSDDIVKGAERQALYEMDVTPMQLGSEVKQTGSTVEFNPGRPLPRKEVSLYRRALEEEHNALEDTILSQQRKGFSADIQAIRKEKAVIDGLDLGKTLEPNSPELVALARYEARLAAFGSKLDRDSVGAIKASLGGNTAADVVGGGVKQTGTIMDEVDTLTPGAPVSPPKPVTAGLQRFRQARKALDDVGQLSVKNADAYTAAMDEFAAATDDLARLAGLPAETGVAAATVRNSITKLTGQNADALANAAEARAHASALTKLRTDAQKAFGSDGPITAMSVSQMLRKPPEEFIPALGKLDEYYKGLHAAAKSADDVKALGALENTMATYRAELAEQAGINASDFTPDMMSGALSIATTMLPQFEGPVDDMLKVGVIMSILSKGKIGRGTRGFMGKMARAIFTRAGAGVAAQKAGSMASGLGGSTRALLQGGAAAAGYNVFGAIADSVQGIATSTGRASAAINGAVDAIATGAKRAQRLTPTFGALAAKLSMDGVEEKDPRKAFEKVADTLARYAVNPEQANAQMYESLKPLQGVSPHLADELEVKAGLTFQYLYDQMPKDPGTMMFLGKSMWQPTDRELYEFNARMLGALNPTAAIQGIADGVIPPQAAEALRETNPRMFAKFQNDLMSRADELRANCAYPKLCALGIAFDVPLHPTTEGRYVGWIQSTRSTHSGEQAAAMQKAPGKNAMEEPTADETYTAAQKMINP